MLGGGKVFVLPDKIAVQMTGALSNITLSHFFHTIKSRLRRHENIIVGLFAGSISFLAFLYFYQNNLITALSDSRSRLLLARHVVDGIYTGPSQLGAIWLPLPQILMTSMVWNDFLYQSGIAGAVVSMFGYLLASISLYKILILLTNSRLAGLTAVIFFSGPNILYLQSTPMSEMPFLGLWLGSLYFFMRWLQDPHSLRRLIYTALMLLLATLTRYEGWVLLAATSAVMVYALWVRRFNYAKAEGYLVFFGTLAFAGIGLWLLWNQVIFGDVLYFAKSQYSAPAQTVSSISGIASAQRSAGNLLLSAGIYSLTALETMGWIAALVATVGLGYWLFSKLPSVTKLAGLLLLFPLPFYILSLWGRNIIIQNPYFTPGIYLNVTYGVLMVPAAAFFAGYLVSRWGRYVRLVLPVLGITSALVVGLGVPLDLAEANSVRTDAGIINQLAAADWFHNHYTGGLVVRQRFGNEASAFTSQIPLSQVVYEGDQYRWTSALQDPNGQHIEWIFMRQTGGSTGHSDLVWQALHDSSQLQTDYYLAYQQGGIEIYVHNSVQGGS